MLTSVEKLFDQLILAQRNLCDSMKPKGGVHKTEIFFGFLSLHVHTQCQQYLQEI